MKNVDHLLGDLMHFSSVSSAEEEATKVPLATDK